jgi:serine/threonine-protein kinase
MNSDDRTRVLPGMTSATVGTQLSGIYELDERIASGGMGEVYRGHNIQTGDDVAIKIVLPEFARDQTMLSLFRKEASILNHLSHDAVVRYHVFTVDPGIGRPYLAMEFVQGESLFDVMWRGALPAPFTKRERCIATFHRTTSSCRKAGWRGPRSSISASRARRLSAAKH